VHALRGYVSFIAFSLLSLLILLPILAHPYPTLSLAPAYANERLYYSSTSFIRAASGAAADSAADIEKAKLILQAAGVPIPEDDRTIAKQAVVLRWQQLLLQWNNDANIAESAEIICGPKPPNSQVKSPRDADTQSSPDAAFPSQISLSACENYLDYFPPKVPGTPGTVSLSHTLPSDGIFIKISSKRNGISSSVRLPGGYVLDGRG